MPSKSSSPKSTGSKTTGSGGPRPSASASASRSIDDQKKEALSLFDKPKRNRAKAADTVAEPEPEVAAGPKKESLDEKKANALSLFDVDEQKAERKRRKAANAEAVAADPSKGLTIPPISQILFDQEEALKPKPPEPVVVPVVEAPEASDTSDEDDSSPTDPKVIHIKPPIIVKDLAEKMGLKAFQLLKDLIALEVFVNQNSAIEAEVAARVCEKHGLIFEREKREKGGGVHKVEQVVVAPPPPPEPEVEKLLPRPPIVTIMGHVDHGKTSLLDYIRKAKVAAGEAGGITQHVGAYTAEHNGHIITFLDTPGHAAFSSMRARGANLTDIVVLVIAANDGMMPTTHEAVKHARAAGVKIIVALNKCDLPRADVNRVKQQLQQHDLSPEDWGGQTICCEVSALKGTGIDHLMEMILLEAEVLELKADPRAAVRATVIESRAEPGKGATATVIAQSGTIKVGMPFIVGANWGKVKSLLDCHGKPIKSAGPAIPCEIIGCSGSPGVGDAVLEMKSEKDAKRLSEERSASERLEKLALPKRSRMEDLFSSMQEGPKMLRVILKCDVGGSTEAVAGALREIKSDKITLNILHAAAGPITESDVLLASASDATILGFNVKVEGKAVIVAKREAVQIKLYSIIYELLDQVKDAMVGLLDPIKREKIIGHALVKQVFKVNRGYAAGCQVSDGRISRTAHARVMRGKQPVFDGKMSTLRRFMDEVPEVRNGLECGIRLAEFNDYEEGDIIECYDIEKFAQTL
jgi:translation initiation factor IF-2